MLIGHFESGKWMRDDDYGFPKKHGNEAHVVLDAATSVEAKRNLGRVEEACRRLQKVSERTCLPDVCEHCGKIKECLSTPGILQRIHRLGIVKFLIT